jgi:hypothetical protein
MTLRDALLARGWVLAALLAVASACSDDDSGGGNGATDAVADRGDTGGGGDTNRDTGGGDTTSDVPLLDTNPGDEDGEGDLCSQIGTAENIGATCSADNPSCGGGGACLGLEGAAEATCYQVCVPGQCEDACVGDEACLTLVDENGNPVPISAGGPNAGVCAVPPAGTQGAYDECGQGVGACESGLDCLGLEGLSGAPFCSPDCSGGANCPAAGEIVGTCALGATPGNTTNCALLCDEANAGTGEGCPEGMTCIDTAQGTGVCLWPEE